MKYAIGIAVEEVNVFGGIVNEHGNLIQQELINTDTSDAEKAFDCVVKCVEKLLVHSSIPFEQINGIGISVPGIVDHVRGVVDCHPNLPWTVFPLSARLKEAFIEKRIIVDTDRKMVFYVDKMNQTFSTITAEDCVIGAGLCAIE